MANQPSAAGSEAQTVLDVKAAELSPNLGLRGQDLRELAQRLGVALADTYVLYLKTQGFHWNVAGPLFYSLHKLTEAQYEELAEAVDEIAERIRAIGHPAPASFEQFTRLSEIRSESGVPTAEAMVEQLADGNEICCRSLRAAVRAAAEADDVKTADLLTDRIGQHEQNVWMLRAMLAR
ncbi:MAG: DNA starvation/stationary phase protection protein [Gammaproteobacteria bacterium]|nr:DNA starvation/stationary phase protection protein [Gammaproteobacteria bacterium]MBI5619178.1 DNA starvation/stationary phase protection protein [Gammaproteobacteria bacterium]